METTRRSFLKGLVVFVPAVLAGTPSDITSQAQGLEDKVGYLQSKVKRVILKERERATQMGSLVYTPNGPHTNGAWLNGGLDHPWPSVYGPIGPNGHTSCWSLANWLDSADWPTSHQSDGFGGWFVSHPFGGHLHWYKHKTGYGAEIKRDTITNPRWYMPDAPLELDDGLVLNSDLWPNKTETPLPLGIVPSNDSLPISKMKSLVFRAKQGVLEAEVLNTHGWDYVNTSMILILWNEKARQNLWFYLHTFTLPQKENVPYWNEVGCQYGNPGGLRGNDPWSEHIFLDEIVNYRNFNTLKKAEYLKVGDKGQLYIVNVLPRLVNAIKNVPSPLQEDCAARGSIGFEELDKNLNNWKVGTAFVGSITGGNGIITSRQDSINLMYSTKNHFY